MLIPGEKKNQNKDNVLVTAPVFAKFINVSKDTVYKLKKQGLPTIPATPENIKNIEYTTRMPSFLIPQKEAYDWFSEKMKNRTSNK